MGRLDSKVTPISGTARGQGRAAALRFAAEGALVVGGDLLKEAAVETVKIVRKLGGTMLSVDSLDVTDESSVSSWIQTAANVSGKTDILYNNAGAVRFVSVDEQSFDDWRFTLTAELDSVFLACKHAWGFLKEGGGGAIINIGSTAGMRGSMTNARTAHTASKGGVIALTRQLAAEGAKYGIRVNCISPGMISTEGARKTLLHPDHPMYEISQSIPLRRVGTPEDVVSAAVFPASDEAAYITGANLVVDGGWSAALPGARDAG